MNPEKTSLTAAKTSWTLTDTVDGTRHVRPQLVIGGRFFDDLLRRSLGRKTMPW